MTWLWFVLIKDTLLSFWWTILSGDYTWQHLLTLIESWLRKVYDEPNTIEAFPMPNVSFHGQSVFKRLLVLPKKTTMQSSQPKHLPTFNSTWMARVRSTPDTTYDWHTQRNPSEPKCLYDMSWSDKGDDASDTMIIVETFLMPDAFTLDPLLLQAPTNSRRPHRTLTHHPGPPVPISRF